MEFKALIDTNISDGNHPAPTFVKLTVHFQHLKEFKFEVSKEIEALLILAKLPSYMNIVTHLINLIVDKDVSTTSSSTSSTPPTSPLPNLAAIEHMATLAWQQHVNKHPPKGKVANKLSTVKCKGKDLKFQQQQQLLQQQGSGGDKNEKKKSKCGKHSEAGQAKQDQHCLAKSNTTTINSFAFSNFLDVPVIDPTITTFSEPAIDPHHLSHTPGAAHFGLPAFPQMQYSY